MAAAAAAAAAAVAAAAAAAVAVAVAAVVAVRGWFGARVYRRRRRRRRREGDSLPSPLADLRSATPPARARYIFIFGSLSALPVSIRHFLPPFVAVRRRLDRRTASRRDCHSDSQPSPRSTDS